MPRGMTLAISPEGRHHWCSPAAAARLAERGWEIVPPTRPAAPAEADPPGETPPAGEPPAGDPPGETPPAGEPPAGDPPGETPPPGDASPAAPETPRGNASREVWAQFAAALGVEVSETDGRDEIRAAVEAHQAA